LTPVETYRLPDKQKWLVRAVFNLYGALSDKEKLHRETHGMYMAMSGFGDHEVIIEHLRHNTCIPLMTDAEVANIIRVYQERYAAIQNQPDIEAVIIFKNHGPTAGTSLERPANYFDLTGLCLFYLMPAVPPLISGFFRAGICPVSPRLAQKKLRIWPLI